MTMNHISNISLLEVQYEMCIPFLRPYNVNKKLNKSLTLVHILEILFYKKTCDLFPTVEKQFWGCLKRALSLSGLTAVTMGESLSKRYMKEGWWQPEGLPSQKPDSAHLQQTAWM